MEKAPTSKIILAFAAIYLIWGTTYLAMRIAVETIPPFLMAGTRFLLAGCAAFLFLKLRGAPWPTLPQWKSAAIVGTFLMVGGNGLVTWAEQEIPSGIAALVVATMPMWLVIFNWSIFDGGRPSGRVVAGLVLGFIGIVILIGPTNTTGDLEIRWISFVALMLAPVCWSLGSLISRTATLPDNVFMATAMEMLCGGLIMFAIGCVNGELTHLQLLEVSTRSFLSMLYLAVFGSIIALSAYVWLLKHVAPAKVATYTYVNPIIAVTLGWLILSESISLYTLVAMAAIVIAVLLITTRSQKPAATLVSSKKRASF